MRLSDLLYNVRRKFWGTWSVEDPRPIQRSAPYTFFLPAAEEIMALRPDDLVKLTIRSIPSGLEWDAERMWVKLLSLGPEQWEGTLDNEPCDMPQLKPGDRIVFQPFQILDLQYSDDRDVPSLPSERQYWDRCMVDRCILDDNVPVHYLYREQPDLGQETDTYPDSGWRIRGDYRDISDEELDRREVEYIALGKVLNADDSWLHLIDSPVGTAWLRNFDTGQYEIEYKDSD